MAAGRMRNSRTGTTIICSHFRNSKKIKLRRMYNNSLHFKLLQRFYRQQKQAWKGHTVRIRLNFKWKMPLPSARELKSRNYIFSFFLFDNYFLPFMPGSSWMCVFIDHLLHSLSHTHIRVQAHISFSLLMKTKSSSVFLSKLRHFKSLFSQ